MQEEMMECFGCLPAGADSAERHAGMVIDLASLQRSASPRSALVDDTGRACAQKGLFQVVNHGISSSVMNGALESAAGFFSLPVEDKLEFMSNDVRRPVRCGSSTARGDVGGSAQRSFLKMYAHPIEEWITLWPSKPTDYREKMGRYAVEVRRLALELTEAIMEGLGLGRAYMKANLEHGMQVMVVNSYPACSGPAGAGAAAAEPAVGIPPHTDYSNITVLLQSSDGLQVMDEETGRWAPVPSIPGSLHVQVGNNLEVLSNGWYRRALHRAVLNPRASRLSVANLHGLPMGEETGVAAEVVRRGGPKRYRQSSFEEFLEFLSSNELGKGTSFIDTLKLV